jgi:hypothetical protein
MKIKFLFSFLLCVVAVGELLSSRASPNRSVVTGSRVVAAGEPDPLCTKAGQFCVNRERSSGTCHVQETTETRLGATIKGPFKNREDGNGAMCALYDPGSGDPAKCGGVAPIGVCDTPKRPPK